MKLTLISHDDEKTFKLVLQAATVKSLTKMNTSRKSLFFDKLEKLFGTNRPIDKFTIDENVWVTIYQFKQDHHFEMVKYITQLS